MKSILLSIFCFFAFTSVVFSSNPGYKKIWDIGIPDSSPAELALAPAGYRDFLANDFGFEDRYFLIGSDKETENFPYVLPGPADEWGGTWSTAGWRTHDITILFGIAEQPKSEGWRLIIDLVDNAVKNPPLLKVNINGQTEKINLTAGGNDSSIVGQLDGIKPQHLVIPIKPGTIQKGGNQIVISILEGSWVLFDHVCLEGPEKIELVKPEKVFVRSVETATYEIEEEGKKYQPLLVEVEHLKGKPRLSVEVDNKVILSEQIDSAYYQLEALMPAVSKPLNSTYRILVDNETVK